jgi:glyoxylase-like metal-dependent hydrolase (beta-lactamase superfamily II)/rhodanese-related sulfurtransferase
MTTPRELFERLHAPDPPLILDVRNTEDFARWKIEGPQMPETLNIPYFAFIEDEETSVAKVKSWIAGRSTDVVVVCAKGDSSAFVTEILKPHGIASQNLSGGMVQWGRDEIFRLIPTPSPLRIWQANRFGKGCLSYMIALGQDVIIVDPHRQIDDYRAFASRQGLVMRGVFDTHLHADHVSGAPGLAAAEKIPYWGDPADFMGAAFDFVPVQDGVRLSIGGVELMLLEVIHSPGHTPGSTCLLVNRGYLLTGDTLFVSGVGRPDLGGHVLEWGRDLYKTIHDRLRQVQDDVQVLPAHSSGPLEQRPDGTVAARLGDLREKNPSMQLDEESFLREAESASGHAPVQYARIRRVNLGDTALADELVELELGKNECAMSRR